MSDLENNVNELNNTIDEDTENKGVHLRDLIENKRLTAIYVFNDIKDAHFITGKNVKEEDNHDEDK